MSDQASLGSKRPNRDLPHELLSTVRRTAPRGIPDFFMGGIESIVFTRYRLLGRQGGFAIDLKTGLGGFLWQ